MAEKTEKATPKKLKDARKKGQVAKAQDLPAAMTFVILDHGDARSVNYIFQNIAGFTLQMLREVSSASPNAETQAPAFFYMAMQIILRTSLPIMAIVCFVGVIVSFLVNGPVFSFEAMKFDFKKLNPIEGIKQKFKLKVLVELLKSIAKITGAAIIIYVVIWQ